MSLPAVKMMASCMAQKALGFLHSLIMDIASYVGHSKAFQTSPGGTRDYTLESKDAGILLDDASDIEVGICRHLESWHGVLALARV